MWSEALGDLDHASRASELAPIGAGCCLADCHSLRRLHPMTGFFRAPPYGDRTHNLPKRQAAARAQRAKPGANAPARQSEANAAPGRITGGGGRGGSIKPYHPPHPKPAPQTPAAAQAERRHPPPPHHPPAAARAGTAKPGANAPARRRKATAAPGRITGGGGRAV